MHIQRDYGRINGVRVPLSMGSQADVLVVATAQAADGAGAPPRREICYGLDDLESCPACGVVPGGPVREPWLLHACLSIQGTPVHGG